MRCRDEARRARRGVPLSDDEGGRGHEEAPRARARRGPDRPCALPRDDPAAGAALRIFVLRRGDRLARVDDHPQPERGHEMTLRTVAALAAAVAMTLLACSVPAP